MIRNSTIVDQYGDPFRIRDLKEPQTDRSELGFLHSTFEGHPSRGLTPAKVARILQDAEQGNLVEQSELMEDMEEKDGHIFAEMGKRRRSLLNVPWNIVPPKGADDRAKKYTELVSDLFNHIPDLDDIIFDMADAIGHGYANLEFDGWHLVEGYHLPVSLQHRPATWFMTPYDNRNEIRLRNETGQGEKLQTFGWIRHIHKARPGYVTRAGLVRVLAWPFLFKNYSVRDLAEFLEIYGLPLRLGKYPSGASDAEKWTLMQAVVGIGHNAAGIIPEGMDIDFKEAAKGASGPYESMMAFCERTQSKAILGGTLTSQADGKTSTNALGNVHDDVRMDIRDSDLKQIAATITRDLLYPILALNVPGINGLGDCPRFVFDTSVPEDMDSYAYPLGKLVSLGLKIPKSYVHERLGIPQAEEGDDVLEAPVDPNQDNTSRADLRANLHEHLAALKTDLPGPQQAIDDVLKAVPAERQQRQMETMLAPLIERINAGESLERIEDELSDLYPDLNVDDIQELLSRLYFVAETWGRLNA